jgi:hypothetical protein
VFRLFKGKFREYSVERLIGFMTSIGLDTGYLAIARENLRVVAAGRQGRLGESEGIGA